MTSLDDLTAAPPERDATPSPDAPPAAPRGRTVIRPTSGWRPIDLGELWQFRDLFWILAQRDIKVRYKQTVLGAAWAVIQPLSQMILFTVVFKKVANLDTDGLPGPIFYFAGLLPWTLFSTGMNAGAASLVAAQNMIKKVYFPRLIAPVSATVVSVVDFGIAFCSDGDPDGGLPDRPAAAGAAAAAGGRAGLRRGAGAGAVAERAERASTATCGTSSRSSPSSCSSPRRSCGR